MATATELIIAEELNQLQEVATNEDGWIVTALSSEEFLFGMPRKGGGELWVHCQADQYPTLPPIWQWCGADGTMLDDPRLVPVGGSSYFHTNGVLCAPWNRLAYSQVDSRGPHSDWAIGDWKSNPHNRECKTLAAMATRIAIEARSRFATMKQPQ
jgi:hypothetical protein